MFDMMDTMEYETPVELNEEVVEDIEEYVEAVIEAFTGLDVDIEISIPENQEATEIPEIVETAEQEVYPEIVSTDVTDYSSDIQDDRINEDYIWTSADFRNSDEVTEVMDAYFAKRFEAIEREDFVACDAYGRQIEVLSAIRDEFFTAENDAYQAKLDRELDAYKKYCDTFLDNDPPKYTSL